MGDKIKLRYCECKRAFRASKTTLHKILKERIAYEIVGIAAIFLTIWAYTPQLPIFLPNVLEIRNVSVGITVLSTIIGSLSAILGIVIAVMLVAFEILRKTYSAYAFKNFFQDEHLKEIFSIYTSTIIVSVLALASLSDPLNSRDINLIYLSLTLFVGSLLVLFPYSQKIISSTQSKKKIGDLVERIDSKETKFFRRQNYLRDPTLIEENPIFILSEVTVRALKNDDQILSHFIVDKSTEKLLTILNNVDNYDEAGETIDAFLNIYKNAASQATKSCQERTLYEVLGAIEGIHSFCAENKIPWNVVIGLNDALVEIIEGTTESDLINASQQGLYAIGRIMKMHLEKNSPYEDEIWLLSGKDDKNIQDEINKDLQWDDISDRYIRMISSITETAIELQKGEIVNTALHVLEGIALAVMDMNLGDRQKTLIIKCCYYYIEKLVLKCVDAGLYRKGTIKPPSVFVNASKKEAKFSNIPVIAFSNILIQLAQRNLLDSFSLNMLGTFGRSSIHKIEEGEFYKDSILFIIKTFNKIKNIIEEDLNEENKLFYMELNTQLNSFRRWMENYKKKDSDVETALSDAINSFSKVGQIKSEYEKDTIIWGN